jgi:DNA invertase Pin-like site-specific DNA recombinase
MKLGAFLSGSDKDSHLNQRRQINSALNPDEVKWFTETGDYKRPFNERNALQFALRHCHASASTFALASLSGFSDKRWHGLRYIQTQCQTLGIDVVVADNPVVSSGSIQILAAQAEFDRNELVRKSKAAINDIQQIIAKDGSHVSKSGRRITRLGYHGAMEDLSAKAQIARNSHADQHSADVWPLVENFLARGLGLTGTARELNRLGVATAKGGKWHPSTVVNVRKRMTRNE